MSSAPTGTVTIVFTDIQGSTALWERLGDKFAPILKLHHDTIRTQIVTHGGYEVKTEGDAFMVAFPRSSQAIGFCMSAQLALNNAPWPASIIDDPSPIAATLSTPDGSFLGLRVRMGVHTGRPTAAPDPQTGRIDYMGRMVNKAARIARAGHGGQVLVSSRAWDRARADLNIQGLNCRDLGEHALRGIDGKERIREVLPTALSTRHFPPIKTVRIRQTNLLPTTDRFVGREDESAALQSHLQAGTRLLTLMGPNGVGKRRLAVEFGWSNIQSFSGGVWTVDLTESEDIGQVCAAVADVLDLPLTYPDPVAQIGNALLGRGSTLLILHDLQSESGLVTDALESWMHRAPDARILVTSEVPLPNSEAQLLPLDPLPTDAARILGKTRSVHGTAPDDALIEVSQGMPLAIELLSAMETSKQAAAMAQMPRSDGSLPAAAVVHQTITAAIDALAPSARAALCRLSMFSGGFSTEAAAAIGVEELLGSLADQRLLRKVQDNRWTLPPVIAEHAANWLAKDRADLLTAEAIHGQWAAQLCEEAIEQKSWHHLIKERENLHQANIRACDRNDSETAGITGIGLMTALHWLGPPAAAIAVANRILRMPSLTPRLKANLLRLHAVSQHFLGHLEDAKASLWEAETLSRTIDDPAVAAEVYLERGRQQDAQGLVEDAMAAFQSSLDAFHAANDPSGEGRAIAEMGNLAAKRGETEYARRLYMAALAQHRRVSDSRAEGATLSNLAILTTIENRPAEARELFRDALAIHRAQKDRRGEAVVLGNLGDLYLQTGELDIAVLHLNSALQGAKSIGDRHIEGCFLGSLGEAHARMDRLAQARSTMARSERLLREVGDAYDLVRLICRRGHVEALGQYPKRAVKCLSQAKSILNSTGMTDHTKPHQAIIELEEQLKEMGLICDEDAPTG